MGVSACRLCDSCRSLGTGTPLIDLGIGAEEYCVEPADTGLRRIRPSAASLLSDLEFCWPFGRKEPRRGGAMNFCFVCFGWHRRFDGAVIRFVRRQRGTLSCAQERMRLLQSVAQKIVASILA